MMRKVSEGAVRFVERLDGKVEHLLLELERSEFCTLYFSPETPTAVIESLTSSLLEEVHSYGGALTRAIGTAVGRLGLYPQWFHLCRPLMESLLSEVTHPELARADSTKLDRTQVRNNVSDTSPAAFAVSAVARLLCEERHPLSHLGFFYLLESTTSHLAPRMVRILEERGVHCPFVSLHASEDLSHSESLGSIIREVVTIDPVLSSEIEFGFDSFSEVYPMRIWNSACSRIISSGITD